MKIRLSHLRRIIRETLDEQGWVPGRWYPGSGEAVDAEEIDSMTRGGLGVEDEDDLDEAKKRGLWANIHAKRARGERPARPGDKGYPKTLDIGESDEDSDW
jgi:hypothetical protein